MKPFQAHRVIKIDYDKEYLTPALENFVSEGESFSRMNAYLDRWLKRWEVVGASVAVMKNNKLVYAKGFGHTDENQQLEVNPTHLFRVASISKLITATAAMRLVEAGILELDHSVFGPTGYLKGGIYDQFRDSRAYKIKVEDLIYHRGGFTAKLGDPLFDAPKIAEEMSWELPLPTDSLISYTLKKRKLRYTPSRGYEYSNFGYLILSRVIQEVTDMPYEEFVKWSILQPLGIKDMELGKPLEQDRNKFEVAYYDFPKGEKRASNFKVNEEGLTTASASGLPYLEGAGGWIASASDLVRMVAGIDGVQDGVVTDILAPETVEQMVTPLDSKNPSLVMGWRAANEGRWWRTGTLAGTSAMVSREKDGTVWVMILNTSTYKRNYMPSQIRSAMRYGMALVKDWPDRDLFDNYLYGGRYLKHSTVPPLNPKELVNEASISQTSIP
ncbi:serine hydrolase domain-containing protein [Persicobacter diffluens]